MIFKIIQKMAALVRNDLEIIQKMAAFAMEKMIFKILQKMAALSTASSIPKVKSLGGRPLPTVNPLWVLQGGRALKLSG